jgi:hypothetical protein
MPNSDTSKQFHFFTPSNIAEIESRPAVRKYLDTVGMKIEPLSIKSLNVKDKNTLMEKMKKKDITCTDVLEKNSVLARTCKKSIHATYFYEALTDACKRVANVPTTSDVIFLTSTKERKVKLFKGSKQDLTIKVGDKVGILVVEKGECKEYPHIPALKIICSPISISPILLYIYAYILLKQKIDRGILELAGNYHNTAGFCAYTRFGFREDFRNKNPNCFGEDEKKPKYPTTLPMTMDLTNITPGVLDKVLHKELALAVDPLCYKKYVNTEDPAIKKEQLQLIDARTKTFQIGFELVYPQPKKAVSKKRQVETQKNRRQRSTGKRKTRSQTTGQRSTEKRSTEKRKTTGQRSTGKRKTTGQRSTEKRSTGKRKTTGQRSTGKRSTGSKKSSTSTNDRHRSD